MKELNLRSDYPEWNWTEDTNKQKAYNALKNKGNTSLFKKTVWNDFVDCLYNALSEMGIEWDTTYGTYKQTKYTTGVIIDWFLMNFTAKKFNAVRYNIQKVINATFIWQYDKTYEGYVGRDDYKGYSETTKADTLYGSAIIELARKLNLFLSILKDEANTSDQQGNTSISSSASGELSTPEQSTFQTAYEGKTEYNGVISNVEPIGFTTDAINESFYDGNLWLRNASSTFKATAKNYSYAEATMVLEELYKSLYSTIYHFTQVNAKLTINYYSVNVKAEIPNILTETSNMDFADVLKMVSRSIAKAYYDVTLANGEPFDKFQVDHLSQSIEDALLVARTKRLLRIKLSEKLQVDVKLENMKGSTFVSITSHRARVVGKANKGKSARAYSSVSCRAKMSIPDLIRCVCNPMNAEYINCLANIDSSMNKGVMTHSGSNVESIGEIDGAVTKNEVKNIMATISHSESHSIELEKLLIRLLTINQSARVEIESSMRSLQSLMQSSNVMARFTDDIRLEIYSSGESMGVREVFSIDNNSRLEALNYGDEYLGTLTTSDTYFDLLLEDVAPCPFVVSEVYSEQFNARAETRNAEDTVKVQTRAFEVLPNTNMSIVNLEPITVGTEHGAFFTALLSFDSSSWYNPIKTENVLAIYQVYETTQDGNTLNLS